MSKDCRYNAGTAERKCKFEPRYDVVKQPVTGGTYESAAFWTKETTTYVRDVCVACGKTIERTK